MEYISQPANKKPVPPTANEIRTMELLKGEATKDDASRVAKLLYYANPDPSAETLTAETNSRDLVFLNLKKVSMVKRSKHALGHLMMLHSLTYDVARKLGIDGNNENNMFYRKGDTLIPGPEAKKRKDRNAEEKKLNPNAADHGLVRVGVNELSFIRGEIHNQIVEVYPTLIDTLYSSLKGTKTSFAYNLADVKFVRFHRRVLDLFISYIKRTCIKAIEADYNQYYTAFMSRAWLEYKVRVGRIKEKIPPFTGKLFASTVACIVRWEATSRKLKTGDVNRVTKKLV